MARVVAFAFIAALLYAQAPPVPVEPPEEDESLVRPQTYTFNPLQAKNEMSVGDFHSKRGNHKAAAARYQEATLWDDAWPEAFFKLGEAREKLKQYDLAREAFTRFIALTADKKKAENTRKRVNQYPKAPKK